MAIGVQCHAAPAAGRRRPASPWMAMGGFFDMECLTIEQKS